MSHDRGLHVRKWQEQKQKDGSFKYCASPSRRDRIASTSLSRLRFPSLQLFFRAAGERPVDNAQIRERAGFRRDFLFYWVGLPVVASVSLSVSLFAQYTRMLTRIPPYTVHTREIRTPTQPAAPRTRSLPTPMQHSPHPCNTLHSVAIKRHGWFKRNLVHRVGFDVYGTPPQSITTNPNATKSFPITTCCCWNSGSIDLDVTTDSSAYRNGSMIDVTHRINNTASTADVDSAFVSVVEILDLHARGHRTRVYRVLQQQPLAVPAGPNASPRSSLLVPNNFGCTITSKTLTVRHVVRLYVRTAGCCVSDPVLDSPVELFMVGPGSGVAVATVIPEIVVGARDDEVIPVATTIPYDTAVAASAPPVVKGIPLDTTGDGVTDSWGYDTTGDGKIDALDTTMDGKIDTAGVSLQYETMQTGK